MKKLSKIISVILALTLIVASVPAAMAAGTAPGKTVSVTFSFDGIYGVDGTFSYSNASILNGISYSDSNTMDGKVKNDMAYFYTNEATSFSITVSAKVADTAKNGDSCTITFSYRTSDADGNMSEWKTMSRTINVEIHNCVDGNQDHKCDGCGRKLTDCVDVDKDQKCDICGGYVAPPIDYTELNRQLGIAAGLNEMDYTSESWGVLEEAWAEGKAALKSSSQDEVDAAAEALAEAIAGLVRMDYSRLEAALDSVKDLGDEFGLGDLIDRLVAAIEEGQAALKDNDQAAVDAAAAELEAVVAELRKALEEMKTTETVVEMVYEEVEPSYPFCNISWHNLLIVLLIISVVLNVAFVGVIVGKKKQANVSK